MFTPISSSFFLQGREKLQAVTGIRSYFQNLLKDNKYRWKDFGRNTDVEILFCAQELFVSLAIYGCDNAACYRIGAKVETTWRQPASLIVLLVPRSEEQPSGRKRERLLLGYIEGEGPHVTSWFEFDLTFAS